MELIELQSAFSGKKVFVTGHTGFKGTWLLVALRQLGAVVTGYALAPNTSPSLYSLVADGIEHTSIIADVNNQASLEDAILQAQPDYVFHLAAQPLVRYSYAEPLETFNTNIIGTANVLNALQKLQKPCTCVCITTDKVYHNNEWAYPYRETDVLGGYDPYSASKAAAELVINSYRSSYFNLSEHNRHQKVVLSVRAGNVIGGGDWSTNRLLPDIVNALHSNVAVLVRNPNAVRPWQHVLEPVFGYLQLANAATATPEKFSGAWNFGPNISDNLPVISLVEKSIEIWGAGSINIQQLPNQLHEAGLLQLDISKVKQQLGWQPKMNTATAVEKTIQWYKQWYSKSSTALELVENDINFYKSLY